jgi:hypothetical protein
MAPSVTAGQAVLTDNLNLPQLLTLEAACFQDFGTTPVNCVWTLITAPDGSETPLTTSGDFHGGSATTTEFTFITPTRASASVQFIADVYGAYHFTVVFTESGPVSTLPYTLVITVNPPGSGGGGGGGDATAANQVLQLAQETDIVTQQTDGTQVTQIKSGPAGLSSSKFITATAIDGNHQPIDAMLNTPPKGATPAGFPTATSTGADHTGLDVNIVGGGGAAGDPATKVAASSTVVPLSGKAGPTPYFLGTSIDMTNIPALQIGAWYTMAAHTDPANGVLAVAWSEAPILVATDPYLYLETFLLAEGEPTFGGAAIGFATRRPRLAKYATVVLINDSNDAQSACELDTYTLGLPVEAWDSFHDGMTPMPLIADSTTAQLAGGASWLGAEINLTNFNYDADTLVVTFQSDQAPDLTSGLYVIWFGSNGSQSIDRVYPALIPGGGGYSASFTTPIRASAGFQVGYKNGSLLTTTLAIDAALVSGVQPRAILAGGTVVAPVQPGIDTAGKTAPLRLATPGDTYPTEAQVILGGEDTAGKAQPLHVAAPGDVFPVAGAVTLPAEDTGGHAQPLRVAAPGDLYPTETLVVQAGQDGGGLARPLLTDTAGNVAASVKGNLAATPTPITATDENLAVAYPGHDGLDTFDYGADVFLAAISDVSEAPTVAVGTPPNQTTAATDGSPHTLAFGDDPTKRLAVYIVHYSATTYLLVKLGADPTLAANGVGTGFDYYLPPGSVAGGYSQLQITPEMGCRGDIHVKSGAADAGGFVNAFSTVHS